VLRLDLDSHTKFGHGAGGYPAPVPYLVLFVADPAEDQHAIALRDLARSIAGAGFIDGGEPGDARTVGIYVRASALDEPGAQALVAAMAEFAMREGVRVEAQLDERIVGHLEADGTDDFRELGRS
jgi:hypothetical protein